MSHISKIELTIKDLTALKKACKTLGIEFKENQKTYQWYGKFMYDTPLPEGLKVEDLGKCDHAIRVPGSKYEIGVIKQKEGFRLIFDYYGRSGGIIEDTCGGRNLGKIKQQYTLETIKAECFKKKLKVSQKVLVKAS